MAFKIKISRRPSGFTLIELMITLLVVAILAALAYPNFMQAIYKSRRTDAKESMTQIQQRAERIRSSQPSYPPDQDSESAKGYYSMVYSRSPDGLGYAITATAKGIQIKDTECGTMRITMGAGGLVYSSSSAGSGTANDPCWPR